MRLQSAPYTELDCGVGGSPRSVVAVHLLFPLTLLALLLPAIATAQVGRHVSDILDVGAQAIGVVTRESPAIRASEFDTVLVVDFGAQYAQLIARRVREAHVYSEIVPRTMPLEEMLARRPKGIILSGGPASVHVDDAPSIDAALYDAGVPVLGICYGAQLVAQQLGGEVRHTGGGEYGATSLRLTGDTSPLFGALSDEQVVWMSHGDAITSAPEGFRVTAATPGAPVAALEDRDRAVYGVQFHPEVAHTERGQEVLKAFLYDVCGCRPSWSRRRSSAASARRIRTATSGSSSTSTSRSASRASRAAPAPSGCPSAACRWGAGRPGAG